MDFVGHENLMPSEGQSCFSYSPPCPLQGWHLLPYLRALMENFQVDSEKMEDLARFVCPNSQRLRGGCVERVLRFDIGWVGLGGDLFILFYSYTNFIDFRSAHAGVTAGYIYVFQAGTFREGGKGAQKNRKTEKAKEDPSSESQEPLTQLANEQKFLFRSATQGMFKTQRMRQGHRKFERARRRAL